jgi:hypothetical protein
MCKQRINNNEKCRRIAGCGGARVICPMEHILGFTRSHWMSPSVECSHRIAVATAMVNDFDRKHKTLKKLCLVS